MKSKWNDLLNSHLSIIDHAALICTAALQQSVNCITYHLGFFQLLFISITATLFGLSITVFPPFFLGYMCHDVCHSRVSKNQPQWNISHSAFREKLIFCCMVGGGSFYAFSPMETAYVLSISSWKIELGRRDWSRFKAVDAQDIFLWWLHDK